jgi:serine/threonine-protein kinase
MIGQTISHYKIVEKLGEGGMGVVYKAEDTSLRRTVALKFPPVNEFASEEEKARFLREAQAAAALNHPNICTVYEIGEAEGYMFIAMEFVDGQSVKEKARDRPLPLDEALDVVIQAGQGLQAAHEEGVVHRDIKSANLMLTTKGQVKIMDFGLAQMGDRSQLTKAGSTLGTTAYMSPEQAQAQPTDRRTDIWSLGVVLYEMLTGQLPFKGEVEAAVAYAVVNNDPEPPTTLRSGLPIEIDHVVDKALGKDRDERYQHVEDLLVDLRALRKGALQDIRAKAKPQTRRRNLVLVGAGLVAALLVLSFGLNVGHVRDWISAGGRAAPIASIAVLPLQNLSGDPEQEYFSDGITESLITEVGKIGALRVISRRSVMRYKGSDKPLAEIANDLNVDAILEGSAVRVGDRVRVTAQLIQAATDSQLWAESYERDLSDILALQGEVARAVAGQIQVTLSPQEEELLTSAREVNPEVYEAYLRGMFYMSQSRREGFEKGLAYLHEAVEKDPADPLAYAALAEGYVTLGHGPQSSPRAFQRARAAAEKALQLDDQMAQAIAVLADVKLYYEWDLPGAKEAFDRALELNPSLAMTHYHYAWYLELVGRLDEAITAHKRAQELDPLRPLHTLWLGLLYIEKGLYEEAIREVRKGIELNPDSPPGHLVLGHAYLEMGRLEEAIAAYQKAAEAQPTMRAHLGRAYARAGRIDEAQAILAELHPTEDKPAGAWGLAALHVALGDKDSAFQWLERCYEWRTYSLPFIRTFLWFKPLRDDPRFHDLLRRMNLPPI